MILGDNLAVLRTLAADSVDLIYVDPPFNTGATQSDDGSTAIGSLFVVNVDSRAKAKAFSDGDPFTQNGVFASITITRMGKGQWNPQAAEGA